MRYHNLNLIVNKGSHQARWLFFMSFKKKNKNIFQKTCIIKESMYICSTIIKITTTIKN